ncbi:glycosyltransferase family 4 protein [Pyxidicoccus xibeiensis]|uniref:glycosyltransferase family 4 protein n=1 Tax=Pyxidicoccus xibeiensis TaxID=2906759 RepID=UPI0020A822E0|nr:glycosyltransferase family 1 protein [Pyxidicoccus xibeiensis]MCP3137420.1 glycosyltransferase family 4 protein [Pyxidicoccus xibeiensis]
MRLAIALGGTDWGRSGIGTYVRAMLPRLTRGLAETEGRLVALGTARDFAAYEGELGDAERAAVPDAVDRPALSAAWYLARCGAHARSAGADVLLLPAANRRVALRPGLPTVGVVHDLAQFTVPDKYDRLRTTYVRWLLPKALRSFEALAAVSHATRRDMASFLSCAPQRIHVIPNGVDADRFASTDGTRATVVRERLGLTAPYLLYLSRLEHPGKNHLRLLRAFAASPVRQDHQLVLAGADWGAEGLIREELQRLGLQERVRMLGYVEDGLIPGLVAGAEAIIAVGLCEGFGLPALEAIAAGKPVLAARAGALPEVVGDLGVLCDPLDEQDMAAAMMRLVRDEPLAARVHREGPGHARQRSWDRTSDDLLALCHSVGGAR